VGEDFDDWVKVGFGAVVVLAIMYDVGCSFGPFCDELCEARRDFYSDQGIR
jgi:hypothetical protein